jgi:hypothetical protein
MCGFIIVSAFEAYNTFYQELEEDLTQWTINRAEETLTNLIDIASPTADAAAN